MALSDRAIKAMTLLADGLGDERTLSGQRLVRSQSTEGAYYVTTEDSCSCADSTYRPNKVCKHRLALALERTLADAGALETPRRLEVVA